VHLCTSGNPDFDPLGVDLLLFIFFGVFGVVTGITMERLFSPCTRLHDLLAETQDDDLQYTLPHSHIETANDLILDVSTDEFLSAEKAFTYADLYAMLGNGDTVALLTPRAAVAREDGRGHWMQHDVSCRFRFDADDDKGIVAWSRSPEHLVEICDIVFRLLAASVVHSVTLYKWGLRDVAPISAPSLACLMEQCQSLKSLLFEDLEMDENHCRVLGGYSRPGLEIVLRGCKLTSAGTSTLAEILGRNEGPTKLDWCVIDNFVLADGLRGNSRLQSFWPDFSKDFDVGKREVLAITDAVKENKGLIELDLGTACCFREKDETWGAICDSLKTHPTLEVLSLRSEFTDATLPPAVVKSQIQALLDMVKVNLSIHTIYVDSLYSEHEHFRGSVIPYLETNILRPRLLAIQKTRPIAYRAKVLGRALLAARTDANNFWMLVSGNAEVAFPSRTTTTTLAANLPIPATTVATSATCVAAVAASVMSPLMTTTTGSLPRAASVAATSTGIPSTVSVSDAFASTYTVTAAANVATSSAGQKRKKNVLNPTRN
jgi:hypothetical protein